MKYLDSFRELLTEGNQGGPILFLKIKKDSEELLSYIIDDNYEVSTRNNLRYIVTTIRKKGNQLTDWLECKYDVLQYLDYMLLTYNIEFIEVTQYATKIGEISKTITFSKERIPIFMKLFEENDNIIFNMININFNKNWKKKINESLSPTQRYYQLEKIVNEYLQYLIDARFSINIDAIGEEIRIQNREHSIFSWNDIKYDFIPFIEELLKIRKLNIWGSRTGIIFVNYSEAPYELRAGNNKFISLDEIINDTVEGTMTGVVIELKRMDR